jgi:hypothetical protein
VTNRELLLRNGAFQAELERFQADRKRSARSSSLFNRMIHTLLRSAQRDHALDTCFPGYSEQKKRTMRHGLATSLVLTCVVISLAGCGYSTGDRAVSGGLLGAGGAPPWVL